MKNKLDFLLCLIVFFTSYAAIGQCEGEFILGKYTGCNLEISGNSVLGTVTSGTWNGTIIPVTYGGTGQSTANGALNAMLPTQTGGSGKFLITNGTNTSWGTALTSEVDGSTTNEIQTISLNSGTVSLSGGGGSFALPSEPGNNNSTAYSAGTVYNITTTSAKLDFGTTDPVITIPAAGTYLITSNVRIDYSGLTNVAANTVTVKLRRTNNTASDLSNATGDFTVPPVTLLTSTGGDCDVNTVIYTTSNSNDVIELWGSRSASVSVGNIQAGSAWIVAVRIY